MVSNYVNIHLPQYPCMHETTLHRNLDSILKAADGDTDVALRVGTSPESGLCHFDYFTTFVALAVSSLTLTWRNEVQARAASDAFFHTALRHLELALEVTELQRLQAFLLLAHYAHLDPGKVDNWICIRNATNIVLELGLHKQFAEHLTQDSAHARFQNQLFWVCYGMERSLCTVLCLPLALQQESITTSRDPNSGTHTRYSVASHLYHHRAMETEAHRVLYLQQEAAQGHSLTVSDWLEGFLARLEEWLVKAEQFSKYEMLEFRMVQYGVLKARLFRPSPRLRNRTPADRQHCFDACSILVEDYQRQAKRRRLFYPWHAVHILFEAAIIMLESCWALRDYEPLRPRARLVLSVTIPDCLAVIAKIGEFWRVAVHCFDYLEPIAEEVALLFRESDLSDLGPEQEAVETAMTHKLHSLLFPDMSLLRNSHPSSTLEQNGTAPGATTGDITIPNFDEVDWDAYWEAVQNLSPL